MKHSKVRQTIVDTASVLFYQNGYNLTGINEIIAEAGIAKATLYSHFKSKEDICLAYLSHRNEAFITDIKAFISTKVEGRDRVLGLFDFLGSFFSSDGFNGCWCLNTVSEIPKGNSRIRAEIQQQKNGFLELIEETVKANLSQNSDEKNKALSKQIYLLYESAISESYLHQNSWPIVAAKDLCHLIL